jgi:hypothetical protein
MRPDQRWFPTNRIERAAWFNHFASKFPDYGPALGFTQAEMDAIAADNAVVQFVTTAVTSIEAYRSAIVEFQQIVLLGKNDGGTSEFPAVPALVPPPMVPRGIFERLERTVRRIRAQPAYSDSIGAMLGIIPRRPGFAALSGHTPPIKVLAAGSDYSFEIGTVRGGFDMFRVEVQTGGTDEWKEVGTFTRSPVRVQIEPATPGQAELVHVRLRMIKRNEPVGNYSNIQAIALVP